jgi:ribosomal protein L35
MPKMKSKTGAAKRFKRPRRGSIKRGGAYKRHILTKKTHQAEAPDARRSAVTRPTRRRCVACCRTRR